jgi:hypothetical protein
VGTDADEGALMPVLLLVVVQRQRLLGEPAPSETVTQTHAQTHTEQERERKREGNTESRQETRT